MKTIVSLNAAALAVFAAREATKARIDVKDSVLHLRPTTRKANTVLTDLVTKGKTGTIEISSKAAEKLNATFQATSEFGLAEAKYGWLKTTEVGAEGSIDGAVITLTQVEEPAAEPAQAETTENEPAAEAEQVEAETAGEAAEPEA